MSGVRLVDTAIKTSRSGHLQRCLIKNLESLKVCYDYTVRDADGSVVQFAYGEDGVDVLKISYITELEVLSKNHRVVLEGLGSQLEDMNLSQSNSYMKESPDSLRERATSLACRQKGHHHHITRRELMKLTKLKYLSSLADPGEAVGVIVAQSVGEPSTQMTLNTFHLAGRGEMNVTLGIPCLQEILMTAKEVIRTPIMTCPLLGEMTKEDGERLAARLRRICVADIVESMVVSTVPFYIHQQRVSTLYKLKMKLYPPSLYPHTDISLEDCRSILRTTFVDAVEDAISKHIKLICKISGIQFVYSKVDSSMEEGIEEEDETGRKSSNGEGGGTNDEDDDANEDQDVDAEKRKKQMRDEIEYEDEMEEQTAGVVDEFDGGTQSGFESEVDQAEAEEDFEVQTDDPGTIDDEKMDEDDHGGIAKEEAPDIQSLSAQKVSKGKGKSKDKTTKVKRRKKIKSVVFVEVKGLKFEAHFVLSNEQHILLAECYFVLEDDPDRRWKYVRAMMHEKFKQNIDRLKRKYMSLPFAEDL